MESRALKIRAKKPEIESLRRKKNIQRNELKR
jgi:hypothetical protein